MGGRYNDLTWDKARCFKLSVFGWDIPAVKNGYIDFCIEYVLFDLTYAVLGHPKTNFAFSKLNQAGVWLHAVKNGYIDFCIEYVLFDLTYAVLGHPKTNFVFSFVEAPQLIPAAPGTFSSPSHLFGQDLEKWHSAW